MPIDARGIFQPALVNSVSSVACATSGRDFDTVVVNEKVVVKNGELTTMDKEETVQKAQRRSKEEAKN